MDLIQILEKTVSPDKAELEQAQQYLEQAAQANLPEFLKGLSDILKHGGNSPVARMAAGLQLKNSLASKDEQQKQQKQERWLAFPEDVRNYIKQNVLQTLGTETTRPSSAAQCVAYIACAEFSKLQWLELVDILTGNVTNPSSTEMMKEATLEAIGYICQDIEGEVISNKSNEILTAIVHGMKKEEASNHVKLAATTALFNSLEFTKANFDKETERHFIMQVVCEATQSAETQIKVASLQCLVKIMSLYYHHMEHYMGPALFAITVEAMKSDIDEVALQGIEFWSNVCDEEVDLAIEASESAEQGRPPNNVSKFYAKGALAYLMPILLQTLTKQEETEEDDEWLPSKAAGVCVMLLATCCEDDIVRFVVPFVHGNIENPDWKFRDAAIMAFGSIMEGPEPSTMKPLVEQAMPMLIGLMSDASVAVRDTAAWCIGRACDIIPDGVINDSFLSALLDALVQGLSQEPRVSSNVCWALSSLAEAAYETAKDNMPVESDDEPPTYSLSSYFEAIISKLLETTDRVDGNQSNLRSAAYEALMEMTKNSPKDCYATVQKTTMVIMERLQKVLQMESHIQSSTDRKQVQELESLLCATLQSVLRKVSAEDAPKISDTVMVALLSMFNSSSGKSGGVQEDALMAVMSLVEVLGDKFMKYMEAFMPFLSVGLKNIAEFQVCFAAVGLVGDICRALSNKVLPWCDDIMGMLLENLSNENVHRIVKPQILSVFGDIALAIGPEFKKYLTVVLGMLESASKVEVDKADYDMVDYLNEIREGCLEAYTGIVQGLKGDANNINPDVQLVEPHVVHMMSFIDHISKDTDHTDGNIGACAGLIGDLLSVFGNAMLQFIEQESITNLLAKGRRSKTNRTKTLATWVTKEIRKLKNQSTQQTTS